MAGAASEADLAAAAFSARCVAFRRDQKQNHNVDNVQFETITKSGL
jgi:hypothetical protein